MQRVGEAVVLPLFKTEKELNLVSAAPLNFSKAYKATLDSVLEQDIEQFRQNVVVEKEFSLITVTLRKMEDFREKFPVKIELALISSRGLMKFKNGTCMINAEGAFMAPNQKLKTVTFADAIPLKVKKAKLLPIQKEILLIFKFVLQKPSKKPEDAEYGWLFFNLFKNGKI